jgi:glycolate oxidase FAD binding subunit
LTASAPPRVDAPASVEEASALLRRASAEGWKVAPRGQGTKAGWGNAGDPVDLVVETRALDALVEHAAGDLVVTCQAGLRLDDLQAALAGEGQLLALDPPEAGGTIGGTLAANASGPLRLRYGTARDLVIGVTVVLADGTVAKSGGKVVKNVAGYDLGKLFCGSLGTLGLICSATFRLHPLPTAAGTVVADVESLAAAGQAVQAILHSPLVPSAIELLLPDGKSGQLAVLFEGVEPGVEAQTQTALGLLGRYGAASHGEALPPEAHRRPWDEGDAGLKLRAPTAALPALLAQAAEAAEHAGLQLRVQAHAASGIAHAGLRGGEASAVAVAIEAIRAAAEAREGSAELLHAGDALRQRVEAFGSVGDAGPLMRRLKQQFDPDGLLNPGRYAEGI